MRRRLRPRVRATELTVQCLVRFKTPYVLIDDDIYTRGEDIPEYEYHWALFESATYYEAALDPFFFMETDWLTQMIRNADDWFIADFDGVLHGNPILDSEKLHLEENQQK